MPRTEKDKRECLTALTLEVVHQDSLNQARTPLERYIRLTAQRRMDSNSAPSV